MVGSAIDVSRTLDKMSESQPLSPAARTFAESIADKPDVATRLARMSLMFKSKGGKSDAIILAKTAIALAPEDYRVRILTDWLQRREAPLWHFNIIHDHLRNTAYDAALKAFVKPGMHVFEIGTGTGILAMLAARAGAEHVYTCERRTDVAAAARDIIARNGFSDRITVIAKDAHDVRLGVDLPRKADLFVAEIVDNSLLGEHVLDLTELARRQFLQPDAILLPHTVTAMGCLVSGQGKWQSYRMENVMGFDLQPFNRFSPVELCCGKGGGDLEFLSDPMELIQFDLKQDALSTAKIHKTLIAKKGGTAEAVLRWMHLDFGGGIQFENKPPQQSSWYPQLHILPEVKSLEVGDAVDLEVSHSRDRLFVWPLES